MAPAFWLHIGAMLIPCLLCWVRGAYLGKHLTHLLAVIMGVVEAKAVSANSSLE